MTKPITNPWRSLPQTPPFVSPGDKSILDEHAPKLQGDHELQTALPPQPFIGSPELATVVLLALNPGFNEVDFEEFRNREYADEWRRALTFETTVPFYMLDKRFSETGGGKWWTKRLLSLIAACGFDAVSRRIMCVEHFPYKSRRYKSFGRRLPSQEYSFHLVREAIKQEKEIVIMRSQRVWIESVPELRDHKYIKLSNHQNPFVSRSQMTPEEFNRLVARIGLPD